MTEQWAIAIIGFALTVGGGVLAWLVSTLWGRVSELERSVQRVEIEGLRQARDSERDVAEQLSAIRETLVRIEARLSHLEQQNARTQGVGPGRG